MGRDVPNAEILAKDSDIKTSDWQDRRQHHDPESSFSTRCPNKLKYSLEKGC